MVCCLINQLEAPVEPSYVISIIDNATSRDDAVSEVTRNMSVVCNTNLPPPRVSSEPPAGIGAFVTSSTLPFVSVSDVSVSTCTVAFTAEPVTLPTMRPRTIVVVELGTVYTVVIDVPIPAFVLTLNVLAIYFSLS